MAEFARKNNCYVVCPIITKDEGRFYNSSILIDRKGNIAGVYHKTHPTVPEMIPDKIYKGGVVTPGALDQPVFETDFGKVGMLICFDTNWWDCWDNLRDKGAEVVLFSSQFSGGRILNYYAWRNSCYVLAGTSMDARVIDISGNDLFPASNDVRYAWATVNLEKANTPGWSTGKKLNDIYNKYGNRVELKVWDRTEIITIESRDPDLKVADILKDFDIKSKNEALKDAEEFQNKYRV
jgi:predicted amidohydrolase